MIVKNRPQSESREVKTWEADARRRATRSRVVEVVIAGLIAIAPWAAPPSSALPIAHVLPAEPYISPWVAVNDYRQLSGDGSLVYGWSHSRGGPIFWTPQEGVHLVGSPTYIGGGGIGEMSPDSSTFFGYGYGSPGDASNVREHFLWDRSTNDVIPIGEPRGGSQYTEEVVFSSNGLRFAGYSILSTFTEAGSEYLDPHAWMGSASEGIRALPDLPLLPEHVGVRDRYGSSVVGISNDGSVFGNTRFAGSLDDDHSAYVDSPEFGLRWRDAEGPPEVLAGTLPNGDRWTITELVDISADGQRWLGEARITRESPSGTELIAENVRGVFSETSDPWIIGTFDPDEYRGPEIEQISGDGSTLIGRVWVRPGSNQPLYLWTEDRGAIELDVLLESLGIDLSHWTLRDVLDISYDGQTLLLRAPESTGPNSPGVFRYFVVVIPEPGTGLLLGLGLVALQRMARSEARASHRFPLVGRPSADQNHL